MMTTDYVDLWRRLTNPKTVEDWSLCVPLDGLAKTDEGRRIIEEEIDPYLPPETL